MTKYILMQQKDFCNINLINEHINEDKCLFDCLTLKASITTEADDKFWDTKNKVWYYMRIVCQQTILLIYHPLFVFLEKNGKIWNCRLLQSIGGALMVNCFL